jgi:hypothetical protein
MPPVKGECESCGTRVYHPGVSVSEVRAEVVRQRCPSCGAAMAFARLGAGAFPDAERRGLTADEWRASDALLRRALD